MYSMSVFLWVGGEADCLALTMTRGRRSFRHRLTNKKEVPWPPSPSSAPPAPSARPSRPPSVPKAAPFGSSAARRRRCARPSATTLPRGGRRGRRATRSSLHDAVLRGRATCCKTAGAMMKPIRLLLIHDEHTPADFLPLDLLPFGARGVTDDADSAPLGEPALQCRP